nr:MAG TPA: cysteine-rich protein [Caudoviricetes sp.]
MTLDLVFMEKNVMFASVKQNPATVVYLCPECLKKGHKSKLPISNLKGKVKVFCKHCKNTVEISD